MTVGSTCTRKWYLLLIGMAGVMSLIFLQACTSGERFPNATPTVTTALTTVPPSATEVPLTPAIQPSFTPSTTTTREIPASPTTTASTIPTRTPFSRELEHYFLSYDPDATPDMPQNYSVSLWDIWGNAIPATPVEATPQFTGYPAPGDLATITQNLLIEAGCEVDQHNLDCPPESPLFRFDCWWAFADPSWIAYPAAQDIALIAQCATRIDYWEKEPQDIYIAGCAFRFKVGYIFKIQGEYVLVNTIEQLEQLFVPLESASQALSYAQMMTGLRADFEPSFDDTLLYLQGSIQGTHVTEAGGSYSMNLYHTRGCGCEPWMTSEVMIQVDRDGTITWKSAIPVYFTTGFSCAD